MNTRFLLKVAFGVFCVITIIVAAYLATFGFTPSHEQAVWGAFGDYFGGILNPLFAVFAFFGVLWSIAIQMKQISEFQKDKQADEILQVVKDIDVRLSELLKESVSVVKGETTVLQMVSESERIGKIYDKSDAYFNFIKIAKQPGSIVEAVVRDISTQVSTMQDFLQQHMEQQVGGYTPQIEYYAVKTSRLIPMLEAVGNLPQSTCEFFKAKSRR